MAHKSLNNMKVQKVYATAKNINGRKSGGVEDYSGYVHWRAASGNNVLD